MASGANRDGSILFLSCDLQNSTQFKQNEENDWIKTFLAFYTEFPSILSAEVSKSCPGLGGRLSLWKAIGDELIFSVLIDSEQECSDAVDAWLAAMLEFELQHLLPKTPMTLKGGAFLATVPAPDRRVAIPRTVRAKEDESQKDAEATNEETLNAAPEEAAVEFAMDFVGPSIDTGFRVLKYATRRYFVLTAEVAHLLFKHYNDQDQRDRRAHLVGTHVLKGVWGGKPYPVFALERELGETAPSKALAAAFDDSTLITDEYPSRKPSDVLEAIFAYRTAAGWKGAIHTSDAHAGVFQNHQPAVDMRSRLDNDFVDTSEDSLVTEDDPGDENLVGSDLPND
ncbi:hypothetical protein [Mycolicibacter heraklionensis]|uniref:hypothetical protein n=1 Tax=Mycolicibacter heraklionensis TaxID=512402 RepID=UPI0007EA9CFD|nr:hypothetical protein [Mycolicibacter heraklionensis]OBG41238.1 hypothetical protein A5671_13160 [Mycolicibacter heraklionensis]